MVISRHRSSGNDSKNLCKQRKRGRRGGVRKQMRRIPLPSIMLANGQSFRSKIDELQAIASYLHLNTGTPVLWPLVRGGCRLETPMRSYQSVVAVCAYI